MKELKLLVTGMHCAGCENRIINKLSAIKNIREVTANHDSGEVVIKYTEELDIEFIKESIEDLGFEVKDN